MAGDGIVDGLFHRTEETMKQDSYLSSPLRHANVCCVDVNGRDVVV